MPATAVNFGPFGEVGMAADMADSMRAIGLHALQPREAWEAFAGAGAAPQQVRVQLDAAQFAGINQARGRWPFLDMLQSTGVVAAWQERSGSVTTSAVRPQAGCLMFASTMLWPRVCMCHLPGRLQIQLQFH